MILRAIEQTVTIDGQAVRVKPLSVGNLEVFLTRLKEREALWSEKPTSAAACMDEAIALAVADWKAGDAEASRPGALIDLVNEIIRVSYARDEDKKKSPSQSCSDSATTGSTSTPASGA